MKLKSAPLVGLFVALAVAGCKKQKDSLDEPAAAKEPVKREARFGALTIGERVLTSFAIDEEKPKRWHYRVQLTDDVVTQYEWVSPAGVVHERAEFDHKGGLQATFFDAYDQQIRTQQQKGPKISETHRSGSTQIRGCAALAAKFDELGRTTTSSCLDKDEQHIPDENGCFQLIEKWTVHHQLAEQLCFAEGEVPQVDGDGVHRRVFSYNEAGQRTSLTFYGLNGKLLSEAVGCVSLAYEYDSAHNRVAETCRNAAGKPMAIIGSEAVRTETSFDANGCETARIFKKADDSRTTRSRIGERRFGPDKFCASTLDEFYDLTGKLQAPYSGAPARQQYDRDAHGLVTEQRCFNAREKPAACYSSRGMAQVLRYRYDDHMRLASEAGFSAAGKPMRRMADYPNLVHYRYDEEGRLLTKDFFDADEKPAVGLGSVHAISSEYDAFGMLVKRRNLGIDGLPVTPATNCAILAFTRNSLHQLVRMDCLDKSGLPTTSRLIYAGVNWKRAASLEIERRGGRVRNIFRNKQGRTVNEVDCSREGVLCIQ